MKQIKINGPIVDDSDLSFYEWAGMSAVAPKTVISELEKFKGEDVQVLINSGGGSVFAGSEIYTALKKHKGRVEIIVTGLSASIASIIMLAGDSIKASPILQIMIHNVSTVQKGDYQKMRHISKTLDLASASLAKMYSQKTGQTEEVIRKMMDEETWFNAYSAKELGLVDEILFDNTLQLVAYHGEIISKDKINEFNKLRQYENNGQIKSFDTNKPKNNKSEFLKYCPGKTTESPFAKYCMVGTAK